MNRKLLILTLGAMWLAGVLADELGRRFQHRGWKTDPQVAEGGWEIELQTPPCSAVHNLRVVWPEHSGEPTRIVCNAMPVGER